MSELPSQMPPTPTFTHIHDAVTPMGQPTTNYGINIVDGKFFGGKAKEREIKQIINLAFGRDNAKYQHSGIQEKTVQPKKTVKHGLGKPVDMKIWMNIGTNDLLTRCKRARKFLEEGVPVTFKIEGQGQPSNYMTHARVIVNTAISVLADVAKLGGNLQQHNNCVSQIFNPLTKVKKATIPQHENSNKVLYEQTKAYKEEKGAGVIGITSPMKAAEPIQPFGRTMNDGPMPILHSTAMVQDYTEDTVEPSSVYETSADMNLKPQSEYGDGESLVDHQPVQNNYLRTNVDSEPVPLRERLDVKDAMTDAAPETELDSKRAVTNITPIDGTAPIPDESVCRVQEIRQGQEYGHTIVNKGPTHTANPSRSDAAGKSNASSKYMTIEKPAKVSITGGSKPTTKNDEILKRFMEMRAGNIPQSNATVPPPTASPMVANALPTIPLQQPPYVAPHGVHRYPLQPQQPFVASDAGHRYGGGYATPIQRPIYGRKPTQHNTELNPASMWSPATPMNRATTANDNHPLGLNPGAAKPSAGKSRWMVLDKDTT